MVRKFLKDNRGNYTVATVLAMLPIMGGLVVSIDYTEMNRQRQATLNALDAAGVAAARRVAEGASDEQVKAYALEFFQANLGPVDPDDAKLHVVLPNTEAGGGTLKLSADLVYEPYFYPAFKALLDRGDATHATRMSFEATSEVRLKNTLEVALVLDNSGSMDLNGKGSGKKRLDLLKDAAKQLVDTIAGKAGQIKQVDKPVQFALVPFAGAVNVGSSNADRPWMDLDGISPIHHENFDWSTFADPDKRVKLVAGVYYKEGEDWGDEEGEKVTRLTLFEELTRVTAETVVSERVKVCKKYKKNGDCKKFKWVEKNETKVDYGPFAQWEGCVEARPHPYNVSDALPTTSDPATLFVPMFAPDETDLEDGYRRPANNNWWLDGDEDGDSALRQRYMPKYFEPAPKGAKAMGLNEGPNAGCTTKPITPLVDVSTSAGLNSIKDAIDDMIALGSTNVPEGVAWGWRAVSGAAPFTEGRGDEEKGNDKVVIVLTDGENTYYTPETVQANRYSGSNWNRGGNDLAGSRSIYSSYGYLEPYDSPYSHGRLFLGTSNKIGKSDFSNGNYGAALNEQMAAACENAKSAGVIVMTVALDLDPKNDAQKKQIDGLRACASDSRFRRDPSDPSKADKLFWNTEGDELEETFKKIADELSNLRIVG